MNFLREMVRLTDLAILYADENDCTDREGAYAIETALSSIQSLRLFIANGDSTEEYASGYDDEGNACHHRDDALAEFINLYWWKETEYQNRTCGSANVRFVHANMNPQPIHRAQPREPCRLRKPGECSDEDTRLAWYGDSDLRLTGKSRPNTVGRCEPEDQAQWAAGRTLGKVVSAQVIKDRSDELSQVYFAALGSC